MALNPEGDSYNQSKSSIGPSWTDCNSLSTPAIHRSRRRINRSPDQGERSTTPGEQKCAVLDSKEIVFTVVFFVLARNNGTCHICVYIYIYIIIDYF